MKHIVCFSGGKDSTALVLWAKENLPEFTVVFCDTGWEHPLTYAYIEEINRTQLDGKLVTIRSRKYPGGMRELVQIKGRCPSTRARFCTDNLKTQPMITWLKILDDDPIVYHGIRADESQARSLMSASCFDDHYDAQIERPLFNWSAKDCFDLMKKHGVKPNPLYLLGAGRVGCFPCIQITHRELKALSFYLPEIRGRIVELESLCGSTFFAPGYIPERFCTGFDPKSGKAICWARDVFAYLDSVTVDQLPLLPVRTCMSVYNLCE